MSISLQFLVCRQNRSRTGRWTHSLLNESCLEQHNVYHLRSRAYVISRVLSNIGTMMNDEKGAGGGDGKSKTIHEHGQGFGMELDLTSNINNPYYITTPIYYVNGQPHLGHAYTNVVADILARFHRKAMHPVLFLTGTDEHGQKVQQSAQAAKQSPLAFATQVSQQFRDLADSLGCSHDDFIRTTEERHKTAATKLWKTLSERGHIFQGKYEGWYSVRDEAYYHDEEVMRTKNKFIPADKQYYKRSSKSSNGMIAVSTGSPVTWVQEDSYFFKLSAYTQPLLDYYYANPDFVSPRRALNEVVAFVAQAGGLKDLSISRSTFDWGIPVPQTTVHDNSPNSATSGNRDFENDFPNLHHHVNSSNSGYSGSGSGNSRNTNTTHIGEANQHIMYVWLDALTNYLSAVEYGTAGHGNDNDKSPLFAKHWPPSLHVVGKDITRFHCIYWPAFLLAAGLEPPKKIFAHGWWTKDGEKMSKSIGNVINPNLLLQRYGRDAVRYYMAAEVVLGNDGDFSHSRVAMRFNGDLANDVGNLAQRALTMVDKHCQGYIPQPGQVEIPTQIVGTTADIINLGLNSTAFLQEDRNLLDACNHALTTGYIHMNTNQNIKAYCESVINVAKLGNRYIDKQAPWSLWKAGTDEDIARMHTVLYTLLETLRRVAILLEPVLPDGSNKLLKQIGARISTSTSTSTCNDNNNDNGSFASVFQDYLQPGSRIGIPTPVFPKIELTDAEVQAAVNSSSRGSSSSSSSSNTPSSNGNSGNSKKSSRNNQGSRNKGSGGKNMEKDVQLLHELTLQHANTDVISLQNHIDNAGDVVRKLKLGQSQGQAGSAAEDDGKLQLKKAINTLLSLKEIMQSKQSQNNNNDNNNYN